jgi:uroporphyrinogen-III synthase
VIPVVVVAASAGTFAGLAEALQSVPSEVVSIPLLTFAPPDDWEPVDLALRRWSEYEAVVFTSPRSAKAVLGRAKARGLTLAPTPARSAPQIWAAGPGTARELGSGFGPIRQPPERAAGEAGAAVALAAEMSAAGLRGPVLFPCGDLRRDELPRRLGMQGIAVDEVVCYRTVLAGEAEARRAASRAQVLVVASPSVAGLLARSCSPGGRPALVAVGPSTAEAARTHGWPPARVASAPTVEALATELRRLLA